MENVEKSNEDDLIPFSFDTVGFPEQKVFTTMPSRVSKSHQYHLGKKNSSLLIVDGRVVFILPFERRNIVLSLVQKGKEEDEAMISLVINLSASHGYEMDHLIPS
jgi:hypothetical protein